MESSATRELRKCNRKIKTGNSKTKTTAWKSESTQRAYSAKLLRALGQQRGGAVRQTADRVLAVAARGQTRWSRAIMMNRTRLKLLRKKRRRSRVAAATEARWSSKKARIEMLEVKAKHVTCVRRKVKVLSRLVPGCRKESLPVILEEAADYIPALEMQIRAMRDILSRLSLAGAGNVPGEGLRSESPVPENGVV